MSEVVAGRDLRKSYRSGTNQIEVLRGINLLVGMGESVSIRGESGSGKSTLLNLLAGLDTPDSGTIRWGEGPVLSRRRAKFLGMVFQSFYLMPELNARENILMAKRILGGTAASDGARADELLARVGLSGRAVHLPSQLSGGEKQRVAIARALMNSPQLILADEPTGNLDEHTADSVMNLLLDLCTETQTAFVLVTHHPGYAARTHRQMFLREGILTEQKP